MTSTSKRPIAARWIALVALVIGALTVAWILLPIDTWLGQGIERMERLGPWGPIAYFFVFLCLATASFPTTPLYLVSGILFGLATGFGVAFAAGALSALLSFLVARHLARGAWEDRLRSFPRFRHLLESMSEGGFRMVVLARISPFIPASVKNYGFGLTAIPFRDYALATLLGQLPVSATYVWLGWVGGETVLQGKEPLSTAELALLVAGSVASVLLLAMITWRAQRSLSASAAEEAA